MKKDSSKRYIRFGSGLLLLAVITAAGYFYFTNFQVKSGFSDRMRGSVVYDEEVVRVGDDLYFADGTYADRFAKSSIKGGKMTKNLGVKNVKRIKCDGTFIYVLNEENRLFIYDEIQDQMICAVNLEDFVENSAYFDLRCVDSKGAYFEVYIAGRCFIWLINHSGEYRVIKDFPESVHIDLLQVNDDLLIYYADFDHDLTAEEEEKGIFIWNRKTGEEKVLSKDWTNVNRNVHEIWKNSFVTLSPEHKVRVIPLDGSEETNYDFAHAGAYCFSEGVIYGAASNKLYRINLQSGNQYIVCRKTDDFLGEIRVFDDQIVISRNQGILFPAKTMYVEHLKDLKWEKVK